MLLEARLRSAYATSADERITTMDRQDESTGVDAASRSTNERLTDTAHGVVATAKDVAKDVHGQVDDQRGKAADHIEAAAGQVREHAEQVPGGERTTELAHNTADTMENAAGYVRDAGLSSLTGGYGRMVRQHPIGALLAGLAIGFLAGRGVRG
jgi:hypothetical protein